MWKDSETEIDFLDYEYMVNILVDIIHNDKLLPASIGVYGDWGSGKSSLMHMCIKKLEDDRKTKCLIFNGWLFESYSDAKSALLNSILDAIDEETKGIENAKKILTGLYKSVDKFKLAQKALGFGVNWFLTGGLGALAGMTADAVLTTLKNKVPDVANEIEKSTDKGSIIQNVKDELNDKSLRDDIREFQKNFAELLNECKIDRLAIFIDELDRCREDTILETLEAMKLFMFTGKVAFIIGADERHISYAVKSKFKDIEGIQIDIGKEYLEKLVQYPIHIPKMDIDETEVYIASLLLSEDVSAQSFKFFQQEIKTAREENLGMFSLENLHKATLDCKEDQASWTLCLSIAKQLAAVLSNGLHGNPRQVKRFLNTFDMRMKMAKYKHTSLDRKILAKLMMLEYIRPAAFNMFAELAVNNELERELKVLENIDKESDIESLKLKNWLKDDWLKIWLNIEPFLAEQGIKLNPYLYFARTSLDEKVSRISSNLSPEAQSVLESLMSKSDVKIKEAIKKSISDAEAGIVLEAMAAQMNKDTTIDKMHMKAFLAFALESPSRHISALEYIKTFTASALSASCIVYMADFAKKTGMLQEMQEIVAAWSQTDENLKKVFDNNLN